MNKNIKLAVAGAVLALSATAANAGIVIPAGDWSLDVSGNVNMYTSWSKLTSGSKSDITGGLVNVSSTATSGSPNSTSNSWGNGLLPNFLSVSGSTRQNDLDVAFTISLQPGSANNSALSQVNTQSVQTGANGGLNNRQAFITVGDKSWGSVKLGKDLGIFASDAILSDITLLGVGGGSAGSAGNTSLGRIGFGYIYADWKPQIAYTTPNFSGFQATVGITQAFLATGANNSESVTAVTSSKNAAPAYEGKASYSFAANDVTGKIWVSGISQHVGSFNQNINLTTTQGMDAYGNDDKVAYAGDIGANVKVAGFDLTGYYYAGSGLGTTGQFLNGYGVGTSGNMSARDSYGGYVQAIYTLPIKTRVALSWGESRLDLADGEVNTALVKSNEQWNAMVIHPLTKHLNLVAEYSNQRSEDHSGNKNEANVGSLGGILFF
jgi:predicted porin